MAGSGRQTACRFRHRRADRAGGRRDRRLRPSLYAFGQEHRQDSDRGRALQPSPGRLVDTGWRRCRGSLRGGCAPAVDGSRKRLDSKNHCFRARESREFRTRPRSLRGARALVDSAWPSARLREGQGHPQSDPDPGVLALPVFGAESRSSPKRIVASALLLLASGGRRHTSPKLAAASPRVELLRRLRPGRRLPDALKRVAQSMRAAKRLTPARATF